MNNSRREEINDIISKLEIIRDDLEEIGYDIDSLLTEEQDDFDNIPDNLELSERYENAQDALDNLTEANDTMEDINDQIKDQINNVIYALEEAIQ